MDDNHNRDNIKDQLFLKVIRFFIMALPEGCTAGAQVHVCACMLMHSDGDFLIKLLQWDGDRADAKKPADFKSLWDMQDFRIKICLVAYYRIRHSFRFSACSAE